MKLVQRTILITGGTSGIGFELAAQLLARGNTVIVTGRDPSRLADAEHKLSGLHGIVSDVADSSAIADLHEQVIARFPRLDTLINNAGIMRNLDLSRPRALEDVSHEIDIMLRGPIQMVQQFLPHLRARGNSAIVNITSGLAFVPLAIAPVYSAAKAGLHAYTRALRVQLKTAGVRVIEIAPPGVETPLLRAEFASEMQGTKGMAVDELARIVLEGIENNRDDIRPGLAKILSAVSRIAPEFMFRQMTRMMEPANVRP